jgi:hypothetical protein
MISNWEWTDRVVVADVVDAAVVLSLDSLGEEILLLILLSKSFVSNLWFTVVLVVGLGKIYQLDWMESVLAFIVHAV